MGLGLGGALKTSLERTTMTDDLLETCAEGVATLTMNRPERRNAMSRPMLDAMQDALVRLAADSAVGCVVLTGAGSAFCAGGDIKAMTERADADKTLEEKARDLRARMEISRLLHEMPKPTIAKVRGAAAGAGLSLALACDLRIASDNSKFTTAFARIGFPGDFGGTYFLTKLVGAAKARELYFTAEMLDAARALELGVVNRVVPDGDLDAAVADLAGRLAKGPSVAYGYMKKNLNAALDGTLEDSLDLEAWAQIRCAMTEDHKEAAQAFVEKRAPVFKGR
jgi:2-(1,2-epoxy-1,2-dihydrophenyl)acetyl-CoA isomerase